MTELGMDNQNQIGSGDQQQQGPVVQHQPEANGDEDQQGSVHPSDHPESGGKETTPINTKECKNGSSGTVDHPAPPDYANRRQDTLGTAPRKQPEQPIPESPGDAAVPEHPSRCATSADLDRDCSCFIRGLQRRPRPHVCRLAISCECSHGSSGGQPFCGR